MGVETGLAQGTAQITLAAFTTLSSAGTCAFIVMALVIAFGKLDDAHRTRVQRLIIAPVALGLVGFISSATHLGKPSNALYVLSGVARSPLSDEVIASVVFFGFAWIYWYLCFSQRMARWVPKVVLGLACLAGAVQIAAMSTAYSIATIGSWATPFVPLNLVLAALMSGPLLAITALSFAGVQTSKRGHAALLIVAGVTSAAAIASQAIQNEQLAGQLSSYAFANAQALVPWYGAAIAAETVGAGIAVGICALRLRYAKKVEPLFAALACVIMLASVFVTRFAFYCMHLTVGL